jgi:hypothetical protein
MVASLPMLRETIAVVCLGITGCRPTGQPEEAPRATSELGAPQPASPAASAKTAEEPATVANDVWELPPNLDCGATVATVERNFARLEPEVYRGWIIRENAVHLPESTEGGAVPDGFVLFVANGEAKLGNEIVATLPAERAGLLIKKENERHAKPPTLLPPMPALVVTAPDATGVRHVVAALESLAAAQIPSYLVVRKRGVPAAKPASPPLGPPVDASMAAVEVVQGLATARGDCRPLEELEKQVLAVGIAQGRRATTLARGLPSALAACACRVDAPALYRRWTALVFAGEPLLGKPIVLRTDASSALIRSEGVTGLELYASVPDDGKPIRFR